MKLSAVKLHTWIYLTLILIAAGLFFVSRQAAGIVLALTVVGGFVHNVFSSTHPRQIW